MPACIWPATWCARRCWDSQNGADDNGAVATRRPEQGQGTDMLIAQITDIHIGFDPDTPAEYNRKRLDDVLDALIEGVNRPDLLLPTGDITDRGDPTSYARLATAFPRCPFTSSPCAVTTILRQIVKP